MESRGIEGFSLGNGEECEEARWELLETKEADGKMDPNRSENRFGGWQFPQATLIINRNYEDTYTVRCLLWISSC